MSEDGLEDEDQPELKEINHKKNKEQIENLNVDTFDELSELPQSMLKKYLLFAKQNIKPKLTKKCIESLKNFYLKLRKESKEVSGLIIVPRHLESLVRICQASAKMHLRNHTTLKDVNIAIKLMLESFLDSQKPSFRFKIKNKFNYELSRMESVNKKLLKLLKRLINERVMIGRMLSNNMELSQDFKLCLSLKEFAQ